VSIVDLAAERHRRLPEYDGILCECGNPIGFVWSSSTAAACAECGAPAVVPIAGQI
jgi:hypothetical protein